VQVGLYQHSEACKAAHAVALAWSVALTMPHHLIWIERGGVRPGSGGPGLEGPAASSPPEAGAASAACKEQTRDRRADYAALQVALSRLFALESFPADYAPEELLWRNDALGKPYVEWRGSLRAWAERHGHDCRHLHISNAHDGDAHLVLAAYGETLADVGIDVVYLPRLRRPGKGRDYLRRLARQFMSAAEWEEFAAVSACENEESLRVRVAAHFSLMEAASKACGTGLALGGGIGRPGSLPKRALGVRLTPQVAFLLGPEAQRRSEALDVARWEGHWGTDGNYLVSAVLLWTC